MYKESNDVRLLSHSQETPPCRHSPKHVSVCCYCALSVLDITPVSSRKGILLDVVNRQRLRAAIKSQFLRFFLSSDGGNGTRENNYFAKSAESKHCRCAVHAKCTVPSLATKMKRGGRRRDVLVCFLCHCNCLNASVWIRRFHS